MYRILLEENFSDCILHATAQALIFCTIMQPWWCWAGHRL